MPNWVYNSINIVGPNDDVDRFAKHLYTKPEMLTEEEWEHQSAISFHSFITLDIKYRDEYKGTHGVKDGQEVGDTEHNWYRWNNFNWLTKWDACNGESYHDEQGEQHSVNITFDTAWSPPLPVFEEMTKQWPTLTFHIEWEEEQGFGGIFEGTNGVLTETDSWDIPSTHEEYAARDKDCVCTWSEDQENWFDDCPRPVDTIYEVHVITKYFIKANSSVSAIDAAKSEEGGHDRPNNVEIVNVQYSEEYKVVDLTVAEPIEA